MLFFGLMIAVALVGLNSGTVCALPSLQNNTAQVTYSRPIRTSFLEKAQQGVELIKRVFPEVDLFTVQASVTSGRGTSEDDYQSFNIETVNEFTRLVVIATVVGNPNRWGAVRSTNQRTYGRAMAFDLQDVGAVLTSALRIIMNKGYRGPFDQVVLCNLDDDMPFDTIVYVFRTTASPHRYIIVDTDSGAVSTSDAPVPSHPNIFQAATNISETS